MALVEKNTPREVERRSLKRYEEHVFKCSHFWLGSSVQALWNVSGQTNPTQSYGYGIRKYSDQPKHLFLYEALLQNLTKVTLE